MAELLKSFLTVKYKLHNPSQRRRAMLLDTMRRAHLGYDKLLRVCQTDIEELAGIKELKLRNDAYKTLTKKLQDLAKPLPLGNGPKQAIQADVLAQAESYRQLKLEDGNTGYPSVARLNVEETDFEQAIEGLANATTVIEEDEYRDLLATLSRPGLPRPLNILKNRVDGGALILKDHVGRLFVFINLLPKSAKRKRQVDLSGLSDTRTGEVMSRKTSGGDIFPLEASEWHNEKFLSKGTLQSSRLIYDGKDFYFAATFQFEAPVREPVNYLGIDRGIVILAAWSVVNGDGMPIEEGSVSGQRLRTVQRRQEQQQKETQSKGKIYKSKTRRHIADEEVHKAANEIVAAAVKHNAIVVMEDLKTISMGPHHARPKGARRGGFRRMLTRAQYMKLKHFVGYRLLLEGYPPLRRGKPNYIEIHPAYTSVTCSKCGNRDKASRESQALFVCSSCGYKENADLNASKMVAGKGIHFDKVVKGKKKGQKLKEHEQFLAWYANMKNGGGVHANGP
jgi:IS605 OrfB family transposase